ncbi:ATP-binding cassette domain-containing protein [Leucobacter musarum]|uniref:ATP-binding cassette domain-containing protein n=1 Tax=Leucobacter musarum TaxID=1930747 RepID=UPI0006A7CA99|nr:ATP-binding cassette domain-containing protein [Leucobacter musarum]
MTSPLPTEERAPQTVPGGNLLEAVGITKHYGGVKALEDATVTVAPGECIGIMGDNGAGKSTFVKILAGAQPATAGTITFDGQEYTFQTPVDAREAGIETVYQDLSLADDLNVMSNLFLGREEKVFNFGGLSVLNRKKMAKRATELLSEIGVNVPKVDSIVSGLSGGQRQGIAIARAAGWGSKLIIMDEPTAALGLQETAHVHSIIKRLKARGVAVIIVSHNMQQVLELTDRVYVFRRGRIVGSRVTAETDSDDIVSLITGARQ